MDAHMSDFDELFSLNKRFRVPVYQRNYDWTVANAKRLFDDIEALVDNPDATHFMGAVCHKMSGQCYYDLVDGQQRITSVMLFLRAVAECMGGDDRDELMGGLRVKRNFPIRSEAGALKLSLNRSDDEVLVKFFSVSADVAEKTLSDAEKSLPVWVNYQYFLKRLVNLQSGGANMRDYALALTRLTFAKLMVESENPQEIFESLNSTGLDLSNVDLLRNAFLMPFPYTVQQDLYDAYWHPMELLFDSRDQMVDFFVDYLILRNRSNSFNRNGRDRTISKNSLYDAFRDYHVRVMKSDTEVMFADMLAIARLYSETLFGDGFSLAIGSVPEWRRWVYVGSLIVKQCYNRAVLLHVLEERSLGHISDDELVECVRLVMALVVRCRICGRSLFGSQSSGNVLSRLARNESDALPKALEKAFAVGKGAYAVPTDINVRDVLTQTPVYEKGLRTQGVKALLYGLEWGCQKKGLPSFDDDSLSIDHIMPQKLSDEWIHSLNESSKANHAARLHMLGNLALTNQNSEMSNKSFAEKKRVYAESNYRYTKELSGKASWQDVDISQRGQRLCKAVLNLWFVPDTMQQDVSSVAGSVSLGDAADDISLVTSRKLLGMYVGDKSLTVKSWNGMVPAVVNVLDDVDHDALIRCVKRGVSGAFEVKDSKVSVRRNSMSAGNCVKSVGHLVSAFDEEAGTELYGTVGFEFVTRGQKVAEKSETKVPDKISGFSGSGLQTDAKSKLSIKYPQVGSQIRHKDFGDGDVVRIEGDIVHVRFHTDNKLRTLLYDSVEKGIFEVL